MSFTLPQHEQHPLTLLPAAVAPAVATALSHIVLLLLPPACHLPSPPT